MGLASGSVLDARVSAVRSRQEVPSNELSLGTQALEERHQLQLEEDRRVHRRATAFGVEWSDQLAHEREVEPRLQASVEVIFGHQILQGQVTG
jgi:hypothetical protein